MAPTIARTNRSAAALAGINLTLDPVERFVDKGMIRKFMQTFGCKTAILSSTDKQPVLQRMFGNPGAQEKDIPIVYPYAFLIPSDIAESQESRYNSQVLAREGITAVFADGAVGAGQMNGGGDPSMKRAFNVHLLPVEMTVNVEYVTNSALELRRFASEWLFARRKSWLSFDVNYGQLTLTIRVEPTGNLSLPQREADAGQQPIYTATTSMIVHGYISQSTLMEQQIASSIGMNAAVTGEDGTGTETFWTFDSRDEHENPIDVETGLPSTRSRTR